MMKRAFVGTTLTLLVGAAALASAGFDDPNAAQPAAAPAAPAAPVEKPKAPAFEITQLAFMAGRWVNMDPEGLVEEHWSVPSGTNMVGMFRWLKPDGTVQVLEMLSISAEGSEVILRLRHFDGKLAPWAKEKDGPVVLKLESVEESKAVFKKVSGSETLDRIVYDGTTEGTLRSEVVFTPESKRAAIKIAMKRETAGRKW